MARSKVTKYPTATTLAGQRRQVWEGRAQMTWGGLTKSDLIQSKHTGKIVSKKASRSAQKRYKGSALEIWKYQK